MTRQQRRFTSEEVEARMVPRIVDALYPVLIPMEQQDMAIQAKNHAMIENVAREAWRYFCAMSESAALGKHEDRT